jgi:hypothetical protein
MGAPQSVGGYLSGLFGSAPTPQWTQNAAIDPSLMFGGSPEASQQAGQAYTGLAGAAMGAAAPQANYADPNANAQWTAQTGAIQAQLGAGQGQGLAGTAQAQAQAQNAAAAQAYGGANAGVQQNLAGLAGAANGTAPWAGQSALAGANASALQGQLAGAASARGGAYAQGLAQNQAAAQAAQIQAQNAGQAVTTASGYQQAAQQAQLQGSLANQQNLVGQAGQQTNATLQGGQLASGAALQGGQLASGASLQAAGQFATEAQSQAALQEQQNSLNAQTGLAYNQLGYDVNQANLQSGLAQAGYATQLGMQNAQINEQNTQGAIGAGMGVVGLLSLGSDIRGKEDIEPQGMPESGGSGSSGGAYGSGIAGSVGAGAGAGSGAVKYNPGVNPPAYLGEPGSGSSGGGYGNGLAGSVGAGSGAGSGSGAMNKSQMMQYLQSLRGNATAPSFAPNVQIPQMMPQAEVPQITSDEETKEGDEGGGHVADAYLDRLAASKAVYSYKDDANQPSQRPHGARYGGVMAQALESTPEIGHQLVSDTPHGKALEGGANLSAALMGLGRLAERVKQLEGARR